jgi:DNA-binding CsgD family transcriptional regulator
MVSVTTDEVSPILAGIVYCGVIETCVAAFDLHRAAQWTEALTTWCARQPDLVPYRGQCLVHRSQVLQARGAWSDAVTAAEEANRRLAQTEHPALGEGLYQLAELHRVRGEFAAAERAYREASRHGREPAPGFELLRAAQGNVAAAVASIGRVVDETRGTRSHAATLAAAVEIRLAADDVPAARAAADELGALVEGQPSPHVHAVAAYAEGSVLLAEGGPAAALVPLRRAAKAWRELEMPYEAARANVQIARACALLSDHDAAELQLETAQATFERLGARADLARLGPRARPGGRAQHTLTAREHEVLRVVATGKSNRDVAAALGISEHTVARHLQNIFMKLDLSTRAGATAYAHEHGLL